MLLDAAHARFELADQDAVADVGGVILMHSLRADVASDILSLRKELSEQIVGLRRAMIAPSLRSMNSTFAPGGDGVGPPV